MHPINKARPVAHFQCWKLPMIEQATLMIEAAISLLLIATLAVFFLAAPLWAQVAGGTIQGTVTDQSNSVVPGVQVSIANRATNVVTTVATNDSGLYSAPNLVPGEYTVTASAPSFAKAVAEDLSLTVGARLQVNLKMNIGAATESVVVTTGAPTVDLSSSTLSGVVDARTVKELPLNGRDWTQLATLETGVAAVRTQVALSSGPDRGNRGYGSQLTISGGRPAQNNYRLDGVSINDYSNGAPGSVLGANLGVDAVEEFSVLTSNYSAEYGRTSGGVVNAVTRSGTNLFHGTAYEFLRNSALDARNYFDGPSKPPFKRNQFGASAGGPIVKNRAFIFGDYEGDRQDTGISQNVTVPSQAARDSVTDPIIQQYLGFFPVATFVDPLFPDRGNFKSVIQQVTNEDYFTTRGDYKLSVNDSLVGTYVFDNAATTQPDVLNVVLTGNKTKRQIVTAEETHAFSNSVLNTVRFGFNRVAAFAGQNASAINPLASDTSIGAVPGRPAPGVVFGDGITALPGGLGASPNYRFHWNSYQVYDDAFVVRGNHSLKFGFATEYIQDNILASSDQNGVVSFDNLQTFLTNGAPHNFNAAIPGSITERQLRQHIYALYVQDDWRMRPNLTINAGLRYEMATVPTETQGKLSTLRNLTDAAPHLGSPFFANPTLLNFEPRVGFAWDPTKSGKTSIRGGFGMFDVLPLPYLYELLVPLAAPFYQLGNSGATALPAGSFPGGLFQFIGSASNLRQSYVQPNPSRNYVMQWNINVQREFSKSITGMVAYVGSRGIHQAFRADDINTTLPSSLTSLTPVYPGTDSSGNPLGTLLNPNVGQISAVIWSGDSYYKALQAKLTARVGDSFQAQASYTWASSIDTGSATVGGDSFSNSISSLPFFNAQLRRGPSDFNIGQNLVISYNWFLPSPKEFSGPVNWLAGGWQLGGVIQLSSGVPFTPNIGGDPLGLASADPFDFPDRRTAPGCSSLVNPGNVLGYIKLECLVPPDPTNRRGNLGRNSLTGPPLKNFDFSLIKNSPVPRVSETFRIQFRIEMFNIFNHANFAPPLNHLSVFAPSGIDATLLTPVGGAGQLDSTVTNSRQIQFGLKVIW
jgi:hypothetical protein